MLLQLRRGTGYMDEHWAAAAAGHVERGETAEVAARREAAEEVDVTDLGLEFLTAMQRTAHDLPIDERIDFFFAARSWAGGSRGSWNPASAPTCGWFPLDALPRPGGAARAVRARRAARRHGAAADALRVLKGPGVHELCRPRRA